MARAGTHSTAQLAAITSAAKLGASEALRQSQHRVRIAIDAAAKAAAAEALRQSLSSPDRAQVITETVKQVLESLGIDTQHPEETRKDMVHLRTWREFVEFARNKGIGTAIAWVVTGTLGLLAVGLYAKFH